VGYRNGLGREPVDEANIRFRQASDTHVSAHHEYPDSVAAAKEHYEDNQDAYHQQALREAEAAGKTVDFDGDVTPDVTVKQ